MKFFIILDFGVLDKELWSKYMTIRLVIIEAFIFLLLPSFQISMKDRVCPSGILAMEQIYTTALICQQSSCY